MRIGQETKDALKVVFTLCLGYLPSGIAFGLLAKDGGLSPLSAALMSVIVYAGSAQLTAIGLLKAGQGLPAIAVATAVINLRYVLINGALCSEIKKWKLRDKLLLSYYVSDETFAVLSERASEKPLSRSFAFTVNMVALATWVLSTVLGSLAGQFLPDLGRYGFDFALTAVFIALLALLARDRYAVLTAVVATLAAIILEQLHVHHFPVLIAAAFGALLGTEFKMKRGRKWL